MGYSKALLVLFITASSCLGQQQPDLERGLKPYGSFQFGNIDVVNLSNANLTVLGPLWSVPQRGGKLNLKYSFGYNDKGWQVFTFCGAFDNCSSSWQFIDERPGIELIE